jgi:hypothetical protein
LSASEIFLAAGAAAAGVAAGSLGVYFYSRGNKPAPEKPETATDKALSQSKQTPESETAENSETKSSSEILSREKTRSIPKSELEKSKRELRTLLVEKELVSAALTRLYEAEAAKEITKSEREILGAKYVVELKSLDEKISKVDAFIQIGDLETLRNQLLQLVEQKIDAIEKRIESTRKFAEPLIAEMMERGQSAPVVQSTTVDETQRGTPVPDISDMLQNAKPEPRIDPIAVPPMVTAAPLNPTVVPKSASPAALGERKKPATDKVEELQKEILEALDRLERLDVDSP